MDAIISVMLRISQHLLAPSVCYATRLIIATIKRVSSHATANSSFLQGWKEMRLQVIPRHSVIASGISLASHPRPIKSWAGSSVLSAPTDRSLEGTCRSLLLVSYYGMKQRQSVSRYRGLSNVNGGKKLRRPINRNASG